ncbi:protein of unknown function [Burkholderia multivorans]
MIFSSTDYEDCALNHADANLSYPALAPIPRLRRPGGGFCECGAAPAAQREISQSVCQPKGGWHVRCLDSYAGSFG